MSRETAAIWSHNWNCQQVKETGLRVNLNAFGERGVHVMIYNLIYKLWIPRAQRSRHLKRCPTATSLWAIPVDAFLEEFDTSHREGGSTRSDRTRDTSWVYHSLRPLCSRSHVFWTFALVASCGRWRNLFQKVVLRDVEVDGEVEFSCGWGIINSFKSCTFSSLWAERMKEKLPVLQLLLRRGSRQ